MIATVSLLMKLWSMFMDRRAFLAVVFLAFLLGGCRDAPVGVVRKLCVDNRCLDPVIAVIEFDGRLYRRMTYPRRVNLISDFDVARTGGRVPLNARFQVTLQPSDGSPALEPAFRFTELKVRRELPDTPDDKVLYFIIDPDLSVRLTVLTVAELDDLQKQGTVPP